MNKVAMTTERLRRAGSHSTSTSIGQACKQSGGPAAIPSLDRVLLTYSLRDDRKQYVVIAAGGHGRMGTKLGDAMVAFALPSVVRFRAFRFGSRGNPGALQAPPRTQERHQ